MELDVRQTLQRLLDFLSFAWAKFTFQLFELFEQGGNIGHVIGLGSSNKLRRYPSGEDQQRKNDPLVALSVGYARIVTADHDEDNRDGHESVLFRSQLGLCRQTLIRLPALLESRNHAFLSWQNMHPDIGGHDGAKQCTNVNISTSSTEDPGESEGQRDNENIGGCRKRLFVSSQRRQHHQVVYHPAGNNHSDPNSNCSAEAEFAHVRVNECAASDIVDKDQQRKTTQPGCPGLPAKPMQRAGNQIGYFAPLNDVETSTMDHP